jgi:hypothetical protein
MFTSACSLCPNQRALTSETPSPLQHYGAGRPGDVDQKGDPILNPYSECESRQGIAAYSFGGQLDPNWHPAYSGSYSLVWALHVEGERLHTGGEFKKVNGVTQTSYARLWF